VQKEYKEKNCLRYFLGEYVKRGNAEKRKQLHKEKSCQASVAAVYTRVCQMAAEAETTVVITPYGNAVQ